MARIAFNPESRTRERVRKRKERGGRGRWKDKKATVARKGRGSNARSRMEKRVREKMIGQDLRCIKKICPPHRCVLS